MTLTTFIVMPYEYDENPYLTETHDVKATYTKILGDYYEPIYPHETMGEKWMCDPGISESALFWQKLYDVEPYNHKEDSKWTMYCHEMAGIPTRENIYKINRHFFFKGGQILRGNIVIELNDKEAFSSVYESFKAI